MWQTLQSMIGAVFDYDLLANYGYRLLLGLWMTVQVVLISCSIGFVLAYPICLARRSKNFIVSNIALCYITFFRGTPLLCQLYLLYYGAGEFRPFLQSINMWWFFREAFYCCIVAFTMNTSAYQAEIMRGALASVPKGQIEAATALGLSRYRVARHVIWPQAVLVALRPLSNELIGIIKASALAAIVTLLDLMGQTRYIFARTFDFSVYLYCAIIYLMLTEGIRRIVVRIERGLSRHKLVEVREVAAAPAAPRRIPIGQSKRA
jgi:polar amino acid transport system permease protein